MSVADAKRLVPALHEPKRQGVRDELIVDSGVSDVKLTVRVDAGTVASIVAIVQGQSARDLLTPAWGQPEITRDPLGQPEVTWASESTGWKVKLDCMERNCVVEYMPYRVLTSEFFGPHVVPPGDLAKLRSECRSPKHEQFAPGPVSVRAGIATKYDGVREFVALDDKSATVRSIYLNLPPQRRRPDHRSVGRCRRRSTSSARSRCVARSETLWRATLRPALGKSQDLVFDNYIPAVALFGDQPDSLEALPEPVLGRTVEEVKAAYKDYVSDAGQESGHHVAADGVGPIRNADHARHVRRPRPRDRVLRAVEAEPAGARHAARSVQGKVGLAGRSRRGFKADADVPQGRSARRDPRRSRSWRVANLYSLACC